MPTNEVKFQNDKLVEVEKNYEAKINTEENLVRNYIIQLYK